MRIEAIGRTDVGLVRERNEDRGYAGRQLFIVSDGLGGHAAGDVASDMLVRRLDELDNVPFASDDEAAAAVAEAIRDANRQIHERARHEPERAGMAATCTVALVRGDRLLLAQVGDSRAYLLRGGRLQQVTPDHSFVGALVEAGYLSPEQARNHPKRSVLLRAVGVDPEVEVATVAPIDLEDGDEVLLCSDGITGVLEDERILSLLDHARLDEAADALVAAARDAGGPDNITVVLLRASAG